MFLLPAQGCAALLAAAITGGDRDAIRAGLEVDGAVASAVIASAIQGPPEQQRPQQGSSPPAPNVTFRSAGPNLAPYTIEYVINLYRPMMDACAEFLPVGGVVYASFYLPEYGQPEDVRVRGEPEIRACIREVVQQMEFPLSARGSNVSFAHHY